MTHQVRNAAAHIATLTQALQAAELEADQAHLEAENAEDEVRQARTSLDTLKEQGRHEAKARHEDAMEAQEQARRDGQDLQAVFRTYTHISAEADRHHGGALKRAESRLADAEKLASVWSREYRDRSATVARLATELASARTAEAARKARLPEDLAYLTERINRLQADLDELWAEAPSGLCGNVSCRRPLPTSYTRPYQWCSTSCGRAATAARTDLQAELEAEKGKLAFIRLELAEDALAAIRATASPLAIGHEEDDSTPSLVEAVVAYTRRTELRAMDAEAEASQLRAKLAGMEDLAARQAEIISTQDARLLERAFTESPDHDPEPAAPALSTTAHETPAPSVVAATRKELCDGDEHPADAGNPQRPDGLRDTGHGGHAGPGQPPRSDDDRTGAHRNPQRTGGLPDARAERGSAGAGCARHDSGVSGGGTRLPSGMEPSADLAVPLGIAV